MKKRKLSLICFFAVIVLSLSISACTQKSTENDVWADAIYTENAEFGNGDKTVLVKVIALENSVEFTIHSDKTTLGEALTQHNLIEGEKGPYGLYIKKVNGITADYDKNQCYWGFYKNGESMMTGVDSAIFKDGEHYELVYTK